MVCPVCRFPKRISGHVFMKNTTEFIDSQEVRCKLCKHLPDYKIVSLEPKKAEIIYRNFNGSEEYFKEVKSYLKENGFTILGADV